MEASKFVKFQTKLATAFSALVVLISSLLVLTLYANFRTTLRQDLRQRLRDIASLAAVYLSGAPADAHATLTDPNQEGNPTYVHLKGMLQQIRDQATDIRFAYTWRRTLDGRLIFVVDGETDPNEMSHLGEVYDSGDPAVLAKLATLNSVRVDDEPAADKWGVWLLLMPPSTGRTDGWRASWAWISARPRC